MPKKTEAQSLPEKATQETLPEKRGVFDLFKMSREEAVEAIHRYINPKATQGEILTFLHVCQSQALDPFAVPKEIHLIKYKQDDPASIVVGYQVYLKRANRIPMLKGWKTWTTGEYRGKDYMAHIEIIREDWKEPFTHSIRWTEYAQYTKDNQGNTILNKFWAKSETMSLKVVMCQGFRLCFPVEMEKIPYAFEEIGLADEGENLVTMAEVIEPEPEKPKEEKPVEAKKPEPEKKAEPPKAKPTPPKEEPRQPKPEPIAKPKAARPFAVPLKQPELIPPPATGVGDVDFEPEEEEPMPEDLGGEEREESEEAYPSPSVAQLKTVHTQIKELVEKYGRDEKQVREAIVRHIDKHWSVKFTPQSVPEKLTAEMCENVIECLNVSLATAEKAIQSSRKEAL